jgi:HK97 gp10 family phage protein
MANVNVTIKNLPQIRAAFMLSPKLMAKELEVAIAKSIFVIQADSMRNTPVDTGRLRASHQARFTPLRGELEPMTNYALFVHDGTRFMPARPFLADAVDSNSRKVNDYFADAVDNVFSKISRMV